MCGCVCMDVCIGVFLGVLLGVLSGVWAGVMVVVVFLLGYDGLSDVGVGHGEWEGVYVVWG